ncbi:MAG TPA: apolipoprotein N-acyltransferase [Candidatus Saccharimonadales bacterium]|nr:apolipoprotein N-acyltransferase [Candidatus Saccharimonadales bacterium]
MSVSPWISYVFPHRSSQTPAVARLLVAAASGALLSLSYHGSFPAIFAWVCPALLFSSVLGARARVAFACGFLHALLFVVTCVPWIAEVLAVHGGMSVAAGWGVLLVIALVWSTAQGLTTWAMQRLSLRSYALALIGAPFLWVSLEVFRAYLPEISFPWALLGYAPAENPAFLQLTTVSGIYGLSFLAAAFNALLLWTDCAEPRRKKHRFVALGVVMLVLLLVGWFGPRFVPHADARHLARVVQPNFPENTQYVGDWYADHQSDLRDLRQLSLRPSPGPQQPDLLIWPEAPAPFSFQDPHFGPYISQLAIDFGHPVIAGVIEWKPGRGFVNGAERNILFPYNSAAMLNPQGQQTFGYDKMHLVPFGEYEPFPFIHQVVTSVSEEVGGFHKGTNRAVGRFPNGNTFSVFICYESIYPGEIRDFVHRGAQLLVNISNDGWFGKSEAAEQHVRMARVRAVENRRWLVRDTNSGISASIDPYGNVTRVMARDVRDSADLPYDFRTDTTLYTRFNDWFAWMCVAISVILVLLTFRKAK